MIIRGNLRTNVSQEFGSWDAEASALTTVKAARNHEISFEPEISFKKQIDIVVKNSNFQIHNVYAFRKYLD